MADRPMWRRYVRFVGPDVGADLEEELRFHLEMRVDELVAQGMEPDRARVEAERRLGNLGRLKEECMAIGERREREHMRRERWGITLQELRRAGRGLVRSPGFSAVSILTLALGIGATTAIYTVLDAVVLRPLPYPDAHELVYLDSPVPGVGAEDIWGLSQAGYFHFKENSRALEEIAAMGGAFGSGETMLSITGGEGAEEVRSAVATPNLFDILGARPAIGRLIEEPDGEPGAPMVAVLGYDYWMRRYGGASDVVGSTIRVGGEPIEVVGIVEEGVQLPGQLTDLWIPLQLNPSAAPVNSHWIRAIGRLRDGATAEQAQAELSRMTAQFPELFSAAYSDAFFERTGFNTRVTPLHDYVIGGVDRVLWILLGAVGLVLLIACANVANLFLVRAEGRRREVAIRSALGAARFHLARHYLAESLVLALVAGALGVLLAFVGVRLLLSLSPADLPRLAELSLSWRSLGFAAVVSIVAGLIFGGFPLLRSGMDLTPLRDGGRGMTATRRQHAARGALVIGQVALALVLLAAAGLMLQSFQRLRAVEPGLDPDGVLTMSVSLPSSEYGWDSHESVSRFYRELLDRVEVLGGVEAVAASTRLPVQFSISCAVVFAEDHAALDDSEVPCVEVPTVSPGFFGTMGIDIRGREFQWSDIDNRSGGAVVTRALADRLWPGEDPIGKGIRGNGFQPPYYRVIGVAEGVRMDGLDQPPTEAVFFPMVPMEGAGLWGAPRSMTLFVRTRGGGFDAVATAVRREVAEMEPDAPVANVRSMEGVIGESMSRVSFLMLLLGIAAGFALILSAVGIYGVISYIVGQRRAEIGIRMALGARMEQVGRMVVGQSLRLAAAGVVIGLAGAWATTRALRAMLYETSPTDPLILGGVSALLIALAAVATYLPARRATRVDPAEALRAD